ncbi:PREDICTED: odorant receptor 46a, isoform A-like isoform X1 [Vollenhovia emeryi]|uniref:odorant receptor 46a, isoform A-like isoform X1 n=1 Tax=Vollenhovia emeryi TaxID=411798 RepID=UPI0005F3610B|nr:PREDICTED: odorant receptor 46a, isoform A-like isoform X1 [Vollenhovia emeryi]
MLEFTLLVCVLTGCWQPKLWTSLFQHIIYKSYAFFIVSSLYTLSISQFMNIVLNVKNSDEFIDSLYMMLTVLVAGYKQVYMWVDRKNIMVIINVFKEKPFAAVDEHEFEIQKKFEKMVQNNTLRYLSVVMAAIISIILMSVFTAFPSGSLTYKAWVPFNYSHPVLYICVYCYQLVGMASSGIVNVACESVICGLLLHICCQLEILEHRLSKMTEDERTLGDCVYHHNLIFEYAYIVNNMFAKIIGLQFAVSMLVLCSNLYRIAMTMDFVVIISLMTYTGAILTQIFIYCWFGNEVKVKSLQFANKIYNIKWPALSNSCKKGLIIIMKRATIPIEFSSAYIVTMNLESFVALLKMSYSVFNLLRQAQD